MNELDEVVKGLNDAAAALKAMTAQAKQAIADAELLANKARTEFTQLDALRTALDERDEAISFKESAILSAEDLAKEKDKIEALRANLANEQQAFARDKANKESVLAGKEADLAAQAKDITRREADLVAEKESYKEKLLADIKKKMGLK
jgi:hypothetical protein